MNKPVLPQKTQAEKDQDTWVRIGEAANELVAKLSVKRGDK